MSDLPLRVEVPNCPGLHVDVEDWQERGGVLTALLLAWRDTENGPEPVHRDARVSLDSADERAKFARAVCAAFAGAAEGDVKTALLKLSIGKPAALQLADRADPADVDQAARYFTDRGETYWRKPVPGGAMTVKLANFSAWITAYVEVDDGAERSLEAEIAGEVLVEDGRPPVALPTVRVKAKDFGALGWVPELWGLGAIVEVGDSNRENLRLAIQTGACRPGSGRPARLSIFGHAGWATVDGRPVYLTASGAIGADGLDADVRVELADGLERLALPAPPVGDQLVAAVRASLALSVLGVDPSVMATLVGATWLAPLREPMRRASVPPAVVVWVHGPSGSYKTSVSTLAQMHFGPFDRFNLPTSFQSTQNHRGRLAFLMKDGLMLVDDLHEANDQQEKRTNDRASSALLRQGGNLVGRGRMTAEIGNRPAEPPRSLMVVTAEVLPVGDSNLRRAFLVYMPQASERVLAAVRAAHLKADQYALAMAGYLSWLARRFDQLPAELGERVLAVRDGLGPVGGNQRAPDQIAALQVGCETFLAFALELGAIDQAEVERRSAASLLALVRAAAAGREDRSSETPVSRMLAALDSGFAARRIWLEDVGGGGPPTDADRWGWERFPGPAGNGSPFNSQHAAGAYMVGWREPGYLLFETGLLRRWLADYARAAGGAPPLDDASLRLRLQEAGLIQTALLGGDVRRTVQRTLPGRGRLRVLALREDYRERFDRWQAWGGEGESPPENDETPVQTGAAG